MYRSTESLSNLEKNLENSLFLRISKNCIVNVAHIASTYSCKNHKIGIVLKNGEQLVAGRTYAERLVGQLDSFRMSTDAVETKMAEDSSGTYYCTVRNYNRILRFVEQPKRVIAITFGVAELFCALGLERKLVGIVSTEKECLNLQPEYREKIKNVPVIQCTDAQIPAHADIKRLEPDFVISTSYYQDYLEHMKIDLESFPLYIAEGSIKGQATMEAVYRDIFNLGRIFGVEDRAVLLNGCLQDKIMKIPAKPLNIKTRKVFVYDSGKNRPVTACGWALENNLIALAGGRNIFDGYEVAYRPISWETVAKENPDVVIVHEYWDYMSAQEKIDWVKGRPEMRDCTAVRENAFLVLTLTEIFSGVQTANAVEKMFWTFYPGMI